HAIALARTRQSPRLKHFHLSENVQVTGDDRTAFDRATIGINAIPTQFIRPVWQRLRDSLPTGLPIISVSKGFEVKTLLRPTEVLTEVVGNDHEMCVLSGPTIAAELANRQPATMVAASSDRALAR